MAKLFSRLRSRSGETLIEALSAILIIVFSSLILLTMSTTASRINARAAAADETFRAELRAAEQGGGTARAQVTILVPDKTYLYDADYTGGGGTLTSYKVVTGG